MFHISGTATWHDQQSHEWSWLMCLSLNRGLLVACVPFYLTMLWPLTRVALLRTEVNTLETIRLGHFFFFSFLDMDYSIHQVRGN